MVLFMDDNGAIVVSAGVLCRGKEVLLCKRPMNGSPEAGKWEFPGGKTEKGETPQQALKRELKEELDITVEVKRLLDVRVKAYPERTILLLFYDCSLLEGKPRALEHEKIEFVPFGRVLSYDLADADRHAAQTILIDKEKTDA